MKIFCVRAVLCIYGVGDSRKGSAEEFLSLYGDKISDAKTVTLLGRAHDFSITY